MESQQVSELKSINAALNSELDNKNLELRQKYREFEIEAALEKVRSRALAMNSSYELSDTSSVLFQQLKNLGINAIRISVGIFDDPNGAMELWLSSISDSQEVVNILDYVNLHVHPVFENIIPARKENKPYAITVLTGDEVRKYYQTMSTYSMQPKTDFNTKEFFYSFFFAQGAINVITLEALTEEECDIMIRLARVFGLIYTRFNDLKLVEAQVREASVEAALERVRYRAMSMQNSEDVTSAAATMFSELEKLGIDSIRGGILICDESETMDVWSVTNSIDGKVIRGSGKIDINATPLWKQIYKSWKKKDEYLFYSLEGEEKNSYYRYISNLPNYHLSSSIQEMPDQFFQGCFFGEGVLWTFTLNPHTEEHQTVMKRFTAVFALTFRRYLDLKKAEEQTHEAILETALEKVRGKAMAMHNSLDLIATASAVFTELRKLDVNPMRCGVGLMTKESRKVMLYSATRDGDGDNLSLAGSALLADHQVLSEVYESWLKQEDYFPVMEGEILQDYYAKVLPNFKIPVLQLDKKQFGYFLPFSVGTFYGWSENPISETELKILNRFKLIIDLTFRRFMELQKSEANAREAVQQSSLDRVRAEIASMRTAKDLEKITPLIWTELKTLGVPFIRCGVFIMDEEQELVKTFLSTPDGKAIAVINLSYLTVGLAKNAHDYWREKKIYLAHWDTKTFTEFWKNIAASSPTLTEAENQSEHPPENLYLHMLPFIQGMLYVGNLAPLDEGQMVLLQSVADSFSTAYARYEDFNKLEIAKEQVEKTLADLKQAQTQLVQAEKMASLGELTAGIAHEIQNPLNFVNNFSEVNVELADELIGSLNKGELDHAIHLAADIRANEGKINDHGKRADAIVKSMLQHSKTNSGQKEFTNLNSLADEYLRLAFHGLRAKDKSFNANLVTDFDHLLPNVTFIPQDIGRVLLNLYNNAFYAVAARESEKANPDYQPTVAVSTCLSDDAQYAIITVKDNGTGIPGKVIDKIFQPFFTTKPTGQGTGLGLSLSYDIIKTHGGEIKVETTDGGGTSFTINLPLA